MSSHRINNVILCGGLCSFASVILLSKEEACVSRLWMLNLSFTMTFGSLFAKTWRVHNLLNNSNLRNVKISDWQLFRIVLCLVLLDAAILLLWLLTDPIIVEKKFLQLIDDPENEFLKHRPIVLECNSNNMNYWIGVLLITKVSLLAVGVWLAVKTRNVTVPAMNDSKFIGLSIYNVLIMLGFGVPITFYIEDIDAKYLLSSLQVLLVVLSTMALLFFPKMIALYKKQDIVWTSNGDIVVKRIEVRKAKAVQPISTKSKKSS